MGYERAAEGEAAEAVECFIMIVFALLLAPFMHAVGSLLNVMTTHHGAHERESMRILAFMKQRGMPDDLQKDASSYYSHCWDVLQVCMCMEQREICEDFQKGAIL